MSNCVLFNGEAAAISTWAGELGKSMRRGMDKVPLTLEKKRKSEKVRYEERSDECFQNGSLSGASEMKPIVMFYELICCFFICTTHLQLD